MAASCEKAACGFNALNVSVNSNASSENLILLHQFHFKVSKIRLYFNFFLFKN